MKHFARNYGALVFAAAVAVALVAAAVAFSTEPNRPDAAHDEVAVKASLEEYRWDELSHIASQIALCHTRPDAEALARRYNLCGTDGSLDREQAKTVRLAGGREVKAAIIGIWHDTRSDGGKAGLTFMFVQPVGEHAMNHAFEDPDGDDADSVGGWGASDMRAWLNGDFADGLPFELSSRIVAVQKPTANAASTRDEMDEAGLLAGSGTDWATQTSDKLWLPSASELCGSVPVNRALGIDSTMAAIYAAEGEQYRLFADAGVSALKPSEVLSLTMPKDAQGNPRNDAGSASEEGPCTWWLRTKTLEFGDGFWLVGTDGTPLNGLGEDARATNPAFAPDELWGPDHARAVLPAFCL